LIEVNLLPGGKKRPSKGPRVPLALPDFGNIPKDQFILGSAAVVILVIIATAYLFLGVTGRFSELTVAVDEAVADSIRYADLIQQHDALRARRDSIAQKVDIIQQIDGDRYVWPHVLDEVARALPEYTWLTSLVQVSLGEDLQFRIEGRAGSIFAFTNFMEALEASPFVRNVELIETSQQVATEGAVSSVVHGFTLEAFYEQPPEEMLETVPLFGPEVEASELGGS
jgi:Tfp pilus assembly protein PilN